VNTDRDLHLFNGDRSISPGSSRSRIAISSMSADQLSIDQIPYRPPKLIYKGTREDLRCDDSFRTVDWRLVSQVR
jgi:hypothetical protein